MIVMSGTIEPMILLLVMMMSSPGLTNISPSYSYYPDYRDDYHYYDQPSPITSIKTVLINESFTVDWTGL